MISLESAGRTCTDHFNGILPPRGRQPPGPLTPRKLWAAQEKEPVQGESRGTFRELIVATSPERQGFALDWTDRITHVVPAQQPDSVYQIAQRLFPAYTVEAGKVHLAGCHLEDRLVCLGYRYGAETLDRYADVDGRDVPAELITALGLSDTVRLEHPPGQAEARIGRFLAVGLPAVERRLPLDPPHELVTVTAIWCKFVEGKLRFTLDAASADLPFSGWTRMLEPPPYVCPRTGALAFSLALTDDGQIVAADRLTRCDVTGRRAVDDEMVTCSVTGERVLADLTVVCPITQARVLKSRLVACEMCGQMVSPQAVKKNRCAACRDLQPNKKTSRAWCGCSTSIRTWTAGGIGGSPKRPPFTSCRAKAGCGSSW